MASSSSSLILSSPWRLWSVATRRRNPSCRLSSPTVICCTASPDRNQPDSDSSSVSTGKVGVVSQFQNGIKNVSTIEINDDHSRPTGGAFDFTGATISLTRKFLPSKKKVTLVRHGLSSWNEENRVQGSSNLSVLTDTGCKQAVRCRDALDNLHFDQCFSSPISRAKSSAELIWHGREQPLVFLESLKEAHLFFLEGMKNVDAKKRYPELYNTWREDPVNFHVDGIYPIRELWVTAQEAWMEILSSPGENLLVVAHKSILRALTCIALGVGPERFRAIDINNGGISVFVFNRKGEAMLQSLNMTAHMYTDHKYLY